MPNGAHRGPRPFRFGRTGQRLFLVLPLTGLFFFLFCWGGAAVQEPINHGVAVLGVDESPRTGAAASAQSRVVVPRPDQVPVVTATPGAVPEVPPIRLDYPTLGIDMPVIPTGVTEDGQMEIPGDAATAGWYRYGKAPADAIGHTVIAAHNGSPDTPVGPLNAIAGSRTGDEIRVEDSAGHDYTYRVLSVEHVNKNELNLEPYFSRDATPRLVLVTCGGEWVPDRNTYSDNVIVIAEPLT